MNDVLLFVILIFMLLIGMPLFVAYYIPYIEWVFEKVAGHE